MKYLPFILCLLFAAPAPAEPEIDPEVAKSDAIVKGPTPKPITPPTQEQVQSGIDRGVAFLLKTQNKDGSWGNPTNTKDLNIYAHVPGSHQAFRAAVTALCISAIIETKPPGDEAKQALERAEAWLIENLPKVRRQDAILLYNVWAHSYGIQALVRMHDRLPNDKQRLEKIRALIKEQIGFMERYECVDGGWGYYDFDYGTQRPGASSTSFVTATALLAFADAKTVGVYAPEPMVKRAVASIQRQRKNDFSYIYGEYLKNKPMRDINQPGGSLGRSQACNLALRVYGEKRVSDHVLKVWLDRLIARNDWLGIGRKRPVPHESWFQVAGYFYYYGHYYAALCIEQLPKEDRPHFQEHIAKLMLDLQEKDGSWWDYPLYDYHQQYGTALTLMTLQRCKQ
jgi:hypothetical protein